MDTEQVKRLRRKLTLHFSVIACLTSILVANNGSGNIFLPVLIFLVTTTAFILVDWLEVFYLGQIGSYLGMGLATLFALGTVILATTMRGSESTQLLSVAGLLIYPQCVLFFQRKNLRVFEQLAIFLLLQMIVAALINDNVIYGILLTPILLAWVSSLFLFARYAALVAMFPSIEEPIPLLYELVYAKLFKRGVKKADVVDWLTAKPELALAQIYDARRPWLISGLLGMASLFFAGSMFYSLPRNGLGLSFSSQFMDRTGIPERITIGIVGRLLSDPTPIFRMKLNSEGVVLKPEEPPYLRVDVFDHYDPPTAARGHGSWSRSAAIRARRGMHTPPPLVNREQVKVEIKAKVTANRSSSKILASLPPLMEKQRELAYDHALMVFEQIGPEHPFSTKKNLQYTFTSSGFYKSKLVTINPDPNLYLHDELIKMPRALVGIGDIAQKVISQAAVNPSNSLAVAEAMESYFRDSGEFTYTLDVPPQVEITIDPIEDFIVNTKRGFCQHYASAMTTMLRLSDIPARIVLGYRPSEWNNYGEFFQVKFSDAHAWVEARFSREQLMGTRYEPWLTDSAQHYWVQFDPTPPADSSRPLILSQNSPLDYAEDLWEDILLRPTSVASNTSFSTMAQAGQQEIVTRFNRYTGIVRNWFSGLGFAWQLTLGVMVVGVIPSLLWQISRWLPRFSPALANRLGLRRAKQQIRQRFYARCVDLLESLRLARRPDETLQEFTQRAQQMIEDKLQPSVELQRSLLFLGELYHRLRFGKNLTVDAAEAEAIEGHLQIVAQAVRAVKQVR
jgi:protein-glutamine gamma-glutamyltransferase